MLFRKYRNKYGLLPHVRQNVYDLETDNAQILGWEIKKFNLADTWKHSTGNGVKIAVVDTGCDLDHPDIKNNLIQGKNFVEPRKDPIDDNGHGTHCSGTIAAENNDIGMVGVAPNAKIMPVKVLNDEGYGTEKNIVDGILWAVDNGADFISMSLGSPNTTRNLDNAIKYAASKGSIVFCAAGNSGPEQDIMYPAKSPNTIAIGSIDINLERTSFTCSGDSLDFLSPGHDILSCMPGGGYCLMSGTSMSTPFAVGCAALLLSYNRQTKRSGRTLKNTDDYINIFKTKSKSLIDPKYSGIRKYEGYGILYPVIY